ncbi:MAG: hypothetical protein ACRD2G_01555 [Terriglobia bacterium]
MIAVASDVHKGRCWMSMIPEGGKLKMLEPIECTREAWRKRLGELPPEDEIALEVSTSGYFVMSVLEEAGWRERPHWVHTAGVDSLHKQKSDRLDTRRLAQKLSVSQLDPLPEAWFPPAPRSSGILCVNGSPLREGVKTPAILHRLGDVSQAAIG